MWRVTADNGLPRCQGDRWARFGLLGSSFGEGLVVSGRDKGHWPETRSQGHDCVSGSPLICGGGGHAFCRDRRGWGERSIGAWRTRPAKNESARRC